MSLDKFILIFTVIFTAILLWIFVPKQKLINAHISFLFMQVQTWIYGALVVEYQLIEYPVRLLKHAMHVSLTFEYFIFPAISALYNIHFPISKAWKYKLIYIISYPTAITLMEVILEKYTHLIKYINWSGYLSWITILISLTISYYYYRWFLKKTAKNNSNERSVSLDLPKSTL